METQILDVQLPKLHEWMMQRNKLDPKWRHELHFVKEKITGALENLPDEPELKDLRAATEVNFFHCQEIRRILSESEKHGQKNFFGRYTSKFMKDWDEILAKFQKGNIYIGDIAGNLNRVVSYEIPHLKKAVQRCETQIAECNRKESDYQFASKDYLAKYNKTCAEFGIKGKDVRSELCDRCKELPETFRRVIALIQAESMQVAVQYYRQFVEFQMSGLNQNKSDFLLLESIENVQNTKEWNFQIGQNMNNKVSAASNDAVDIDWGDDTSGNNNNNNNSNNNNNDAADIDWGIDADVNNNSNNNNNDAVDIDWGDFSADGGTSNNNNNNNTEIDWGVSSDDANANAADMITVSSSGLDQVNVFEDNKSRNKLLDDLFELDAFLKQRLVEIESADLSIMNDLSSEAPLLLQQQSADTISRMLVSVAEIVNLLNSPATQQLILMAVSPTFLDKIVTGMEQKVQNSEKMLKGVTQSKATKAELAVQIAGFQKELADVISQTKKTKKQLEEVLCNEFKGCKVNIIGEINTI